ncbi:hypothetical protein PAXRUDRAFT_27686 [Paxillus rubicundulus Ve08.2h10]|uniref:Uncharacterized protein n=1 Tax=Paxillus rubicundulus Ve08.2h10 TaxID=930991 RepID=A0A0D0D1Y1_9AGAM|nr:hypothetical protein PAXRUDRAFT_27686 [Paxillus rubicundulus Ve08.2h10]
MAEATEGYQAQYLLSEVDTVLERIIRWSHKTHHLLPHCPNQASSNPANKLCDIETMSLPLPVAVLDDCRRCEVGGTGPQAEHGCSQRDMEGGDFGVEDSASPDYVIDAETDAESTIGDITEGGEMCGHGLTCQWDHSFEHHCPPSIEEVCKALKELHLLLQPPHHD